MDTITTIQSLLTCNGSAQPVTVALMPSESRLIAAAPAMLEALKAVERDMTGIRFGDVRDKVRGAIALATKRG